MDIEIKEREILMKELKKLFYSPGYDGLNVGDVDTAEFLTARAEKILFPERKEVGS